VEHHRRPRSLAHRFKLIGSVDARDVRSTPSTGTETDAPYSLSTPCYCSGERMLARNDPDGRRPRTELR
jgi:hypothetical protein